MMRYVLIAIASFVLSGCAQLKPDTGPGFIAQPNLPAKPAEGMARIEVRSQGCSSLLNSCENIPATLDVYMNDKKFGKGAGEEPVIKADIQPQLVILESCVSRLKPWDQKYICDTKVFKAEAEKIYRFVEKIKFRPFTILPEITLNQEITMD